LQLHLEEHVSYFLKSSGLGEILEMHSAVFNDIDSSIWHGNHCIDEQQKEIVLWTVT